MRTNREQIEQRIQEELRNIIRTPGYRSRVVGSLLRDGLITVRQSHELFKLGRQLDQARWELDESHRKLREEPFGLSMAQQIISQFPGIEAHLEEHRIAVLGKPIPEFPWDATNQCFNHDFPDTGMKKSWCKRCEVEGEFDPATGTFRAK